MAAVLANIKKFAVFSYIITQVVSCKNMHECYIYSVCASVSRLLTKMPLTRKQKIRRKLKKNLMNL